MLPEKQPEKTWKCHTCNTIFAPSSKDYNCPNCHSTNTIPNYKVQPKEQDPINKSEMLPEVGLPSKRCPKCGEEMEDMYLQLQSVIKIRPLGKGRPRGMVDESKCQVTISKESPYDTWQDPVYIDGKIILAKGNKSSNNEGEWMRRVLHCEDCRLVIMSYVDIERKRALIRLKL